MMTENTEALGRLHTYSTNVQAARQMR